MSDLPLPLTGFYVVGGTMKPDAPSYIKRDADEELYRLINAGEFCYILTSRQMGKSSLMARTAERLRAEKKAHIAIVDLSLIGTEQEKKSAARWYNGICRRICRELYMNADMGSWWRNREDLPAVQRLSEFFSDVILAETANTKRPVVIFADEIDTTISLPYADDFFAAIRACYSARANDYEFDRLNFVLLGSASPSDLIANVKRTPFNIGHPIDLTDFTFDEARPLLTGLGPNSAQGERLLRRVLYWTGGHPYMTQRLCAILAQETRETRGEEDVDWAVRKHFLDPAAIREDSNLRFVRDRLTNYRQPRREFLRLYRRIYRGDNVMNLPLSPLHSALKLSGAVVAGKDGLLRVRNEIYRRVFSDKWARGAIPVDWNRRVAVGTLALTFILVVSGLIGVLVWSTRISEEQAAEKILTGIGIDEQIAAEEVRKWRELAVAGEHVRVNATEIACSNFLVARMAKKKAELFAHVIVGLDPEGTFSSEVAREIILPGMRKSGADDATYIGCAKIAGSLHLDPALTAEVSLQLMNRLRSERNAEVSIALANALASFGTRIKSQTAKPLASILLERMSDEQNSEVLVALAEALASLDSELDPKEAQVAAAALVRRMQTDQDSYLVSLLGKALGNLSAKLEPKDVHAGALVLLQRMQTEQDNSDLTAALGEAFGSLSGKLEPKDLQSAALVLVEEMRTEERGDLLLRLDEALDRLSGRLRPEDSEELVLKLAERMDTELNGRSLSALGKALASLSIGMDPRRVLSLTSRIEGRIKIEREDERFLSLWEALGDLSGKLRSKDVHPTAVALVEQMTKNEQSSHALAALGTVLGSFCSKLEAKDVKPAALAVMRKMEIEQNSYDLASLGMALGSFCSKLEREDVRPAVSVLIERMKIEEISPALAALGAALCGLSGKLDLNDAKVGTTALERRMKTEQNSYDLLYLAKSWVVLERVASSETGGQQRLQKYIDLLKLPFISGDTQRELLTGLELLAGDRFEGNIWRFVDWVKKSETDNGYHLDLQIR
jgi:hypothetical protein